MNNRDGKKPIIATYAPGKAQAYGVVLLVLAGKVFVLAGALLVLAGTLRAESPAADYFASPYRTSRAVAGRHAVHGLHLGNIRHNLKDSLDVVGWIARVPCSSRQNSLGPHM